MSVNNESLDVVKPSEQKRAPELEYKAASQDSLSMFAAAIGGAVLGVLATLLILALINGGTLNFIRPERLDVMESNVTRINENLGAVSFNVDTVAQQVTEMRDSLATAQASLEAQGGSVEEITAAMATLETTRAQFDAFLSVLGQAVETANAAGAPVAAAEPVMAVEAAPAAEVAPVAPAGPVVEPNSSVAADAVAVLFFVDGNANGLLDGDETNVVGAVAVLTGAAGEAIEATSGDAGVLFEGLAAGDYTLTAGDASVALTVAESGEEGQVVYIPVAE